MKEKCVLYDRDCIGCGECEFCDLDPTKICDNCGKCLEEYNIDYAAIKIDRVENGDIGDDCDDDCDCQSHRSATEHNHKH